MTEIIDFIFVCLKSIWNLIVSSWVLSMPFLLAILALVVGLIRASREDA